MENYEIKELMAGNDDETLWVTIGFSSELEEFDVLHIVCAEEIDEQDIASNMDGIYLERFDQAYSCYKCASQISVNHNSILIQFNKIGMEALDFSNKIKFIIPKSLENINDVKHVFEKNGIINLWKHN
jgi:hypothetical protein